MDTSQAHLSSKPGAVSKDSTKPDNLSKDELTAVLKYGAQKMYVCLMSPLLAPSPSMMPLAINDLLTLFDCRFDKDDTQQNKKLDEMDLDDILNRAEDHETMASGGDGGTSLGGEGFLAQFAAVSDVKNDLNWEDIIPYEERLKFEKEEEDRKLAELAEQSRERKRSHAPVSYEGMDVDQPPAPAPKKPKVTGAVRKTASQKAMELKERDIRVLVRSLQRWGDIRQRYEVIVSASSLFV